MATVPYVGGRRVPVDGMSAGVALLAAGCLPGRRHRTPGHARAEADENTARRVD